MGLGLQNLSPRLKLDRQSIPGGHRGKAPEQAAGEASDKPSKLLGVSQPYCWGSNGGLWRECKGGRGLNWPGSRARAQGTGAKSEKQDHRRGKKQGRGPIAHEGHRTEAWALEGGERVGNS